nr:MAG TPA: hypothetical protein [Crassvirales sp.]
MLGTRLITRVGSKINTPILLPQYLLICLFLRSKNVRNKTHNTSRIQNKYTQSRHLMNDCRVFIIRHIWVIHLSSERISHILMLLIHRFRVLSLFFNRGQTISSSVII